MILITLNPSKRCLGFRIRISDSPEYDHQFKKPIQQCSIISFDRSEGEFNTHQLQVKTQGCSESSCTMKINPNLHEGEVILDGTSIVCNQQPYFGIITKSKSHENSPISNII